MLWAWLHIDVAIDNTKPLPYGALGCIPVGKAENKQVNL